MAGKTKPFDMLSSCSGQGLNKLAEGEGPWSNAFCSVPDSSKQIGMGKSSIAYGRVAFATETGAIPETCSA